jgi:hypothetical protein
LNLAGHLPPPPLSNSYCVDEKLVFLRNNTPRRPNLLVIGSSVAWRNVNSSVLASEVPGARPLNSGFCGMQVHQSAFIASWMIERWPSIRQVLLVVSPLDNRSCRGSGGVFDPHDARRFVFDRQPAWSFYLRYFDPVSLARNVDRQIQNREQARVLGTSREYTRYGDGPLHTTRNRGLFYGPMPSLHAECFEALRSLALGLQAEDRRFMVVTMPMHPGWIARHDADGSVRRRFAQQIERAIEGTGADFWNAAAGDVLDRSAFTDALHIRWSATSAFTKAIIHNLDLAKSSS